MSKDNTYIIQQNVAGEWYSQYPITYVGFPAYKRDCDRNPNKYRIMDFEGKNVIYPIPEDRLITMSLAERAEAWAREQGRYIPDKNTALGAHKWHIMYLEWVVYAFEHPEEEYSKLVIELGLPPTVFMELDPATSLQDKQVL